MNVEQWYRHVLRFYPEYFRDEFEDEMVDTFVLGLSDEIAQGQVAVVSYLVCEFVDNLINITQLRIESSQNDFASLPLSIRELIKARWIIRFGSLAYTLFLVMISWTSLKANPSAESYLMPVLSLR